MAAKSSSTTILDTTGNPAPLGLMGFDEHSSLLNFHNIGAYPLDAMVLSMGLFYGGVGQIIAGIMEWKRTIHSAQRLLLILLFLADFGIPYVCPKCSLQQLQQMFPWILS